MAIDDHMSAASSGNCQQIDRKGVQLHNCGGGPSSQQRTMSGSWKTKVRMLNTGTACTGGKQTQPCF